MRLLIFLTTLLFSPGVAMGWESLGDRDGVQTYRQSVSDSDLYSFRGVTTVAAPIGKVFDVIVDRERRLEWVDRLIENRELSMAHEYDQVIYQIFDLPWPLNDRDYVYRAKAYQPAPGEVVVQMKSLDSPLAPPTAGVRAVLDYSTYRLRKISDQATEVEVEIHTDPKGHLPAFIVNLIQKSWPRKTLEGIKAQVQKPFIKDRPLPPMAARSH